MKVILRGTFEQGNLTLAIRETRYCNSQTEKISSSILILPSTERIVKKKARFMLVITENLPLLGTGPGVRTTISANL